MKNTDKVNLTITFGELKQLMMHIDDNPEIVRQILKPVIDEKMQKLLRRQIYTASKTAPTAQEREQARQDYLDLVGVPADFRWTQKKDISDTSNE